MSSQRLRQPSDRDLRDVQDEGRVEIANDNKRKHDDGKAIRLAAASESISLRDTIESSDCHRPPWSLVKFLESLHRQAKRRHALITRGVQLDCSLEMGGKSCELIDVGH